MQLRINRKIVLLFILYGTLVGILTILLYPRDPIYLYILNAPGLWLGDIVYNLAINLLGNPTSPQAHYTIPWIFRVPQVYLLTSIIFWTLIGITLSLIYTKRIG